MWSCPAKRFGLLFAETVDFYRQGGLGPGPGPGPAFRPSPNLYPSGRIGLVVGIYLIFL